MLENYPRNPFLIFIFAIIGAAIRFAFFYMISFIRGSIPPHFKDYSDGFKQMVYNLLLVVFLVVAIVLIVIYNEFGGITLEQYNK